MQDKQNSKNWGSLVIALDPRLMGPIEEFQENANIMCERVKNAKKLPTECTDKETPIYLPGERGDELAEKQLMDGTIEVSSKIYNKLLEISA